jgi:hypothetical protein
MRTRSLAMPVALLLTLDLSSVAYWYQLSRMLFLPFPSRFRGGPCR